MALVDKYKLFKERFEKIDTITLKALLEQYEWERENELGLHSFKINILKQELNKRRTIA